MKKIITLAGSNSQKSINKSLLSHTTSLIENVEIISIDLNDYVLPIYGVDFEAENGIPSAAKRLNESFDMADGFIISLAEHNGSYTAVFKNTLDWLSRVDINVWKNKPMFLLSTSPGKRGGLTTLESAKTFFPHLGGNIITDFSLGSFYDNFSEGKISNNEIKEGLRTKVMLFEQHINN
jgi:NAD(P)H-dependent FMN reductase